MNHLVDRDYYTPDDVALYYGVSRRTVRRWIDYGELPAGLVGGLLRIPWASMLTFDTKMNYADPQAWLADVLAHIAEMPKNRLPELLPWEWKAAQNITKAA